MIESAAVIFWLDLAYQLYELKVRRDVVMARIQKAVAEGAGEAEVAIMLMKMRDEALSSLDKAIEAAP